MYRTIDSSTKLIDCSTVQFVEQNMICIILIEKLNAKKVCRDTLDFKMFPDALIDILTHIQSIRKL